MSRVGNKLTIATIQNKVDVINQYFEWTEATPA